MNQFTNLLQKGAVEAREYSLTSPDAEKFGVEWLQSLAKRMESASQLDSQEQVERAIDALAYSICDSGPVGSQFAPSFTQALDALQRLRKRGAKV
jgi:hypothetical protein